MKNVSLAGATAIAIASALWIRKDYRDWRALGPGGLPHTPAGWLTMTWLRFQGHDPLHVRGHRRGDNSPPVSEVLVHLPSREARPKVAAYPIPQRVLDEPPPASLQDAVRRIFDAFTPALEYRTSRWEKHNRALFLRKPDPVEVGHVHPSDASMHVTLAPADAQQVIDLGWGELHKLAGGKLGLPATYTLLYPPRSDADLEPIAAIVTAAVNYATAGA